MSEVVAAGGVVWRRDESGIVEIALVHRPKFDDWSLPKGKVELGESVIACSYREIMEETGFEVAFGRFLGKASYEFSNAGHRGIKTVHYWAAEFIEAKGAPNPQEIDQIRWVNPRKIDSIGLKESDLEIINLFLAIDLDTTPLILLRHAKAVERKDWIGDDGDRPLSHYGVLQSKRLIANLVPYQVSEIHSSTAVRCYETINPLARALGTNYFLSEHLSEYEFSRNKSSVEKYFKQLLKNDFPTLACSHNPILPYLLSLQVERVGIEVNPTRLEPGDAWILHHINNEVVAVDYLEVPFVD